MIKILLATLILGWILSLQSAPATADEGYLWKGDEVWAGGVCPDSSTLTAMAEMYVRSIDEGNIAWGAAMESGECFTLDSQGLFVLGDRIGSWTVADGDVVEVWTLLMPGSAYPFLYAAFTRGSGGRHDVPYNDSGG